MQICNDKWQNRWKIARDFFIVMFARESWAREVAITRPSVGHCWIDNAERHFIKVNPDQSMTCDFCSITEDIKCFLIDCLEVIQPQGKLV